MLADFHQISDDLFAEPFDLCIAGTGPAGMSVALKVAKAGGRVLLLEAGGLGPTSESAEIYRGRSIGTITYNHIDKCRLRYFGGTSGHWSGLCGKFSPLDFAEREIYGMPSWPITLDEAYRFEDEAKDILDINGQPLRPQDPAPVPSPRIQPVRLARSQPTRFGQKYAQEITDSDRITCLYNANVTALPWVLMASG